MPNVLIVDDILENRYVLEALLQNNGFSTVSATNGEEALNLAREQNPDLIITDILMPVMDGYTLCRKIKEDDRLKRIPLVFYTATYTDERDVEFGLSLGADRFIIKPQEPLDILRVLKEVLGEVGTAGMTASPLGAEMEFFRQHNAVLFRKLEKKMADLERTNAALQREIAVRQQAETALRESEEKLRSILDCSPVGIIWANIRDGIQYVNRKFVEMFGYARDDLPTLKDFFQLAHPEISDLALIFPWIASLEDTLKTGISPPSFEGRLAGRDGRYRDVSINCACIGNICLLVFTDITEQKQLQEQLQQSQKLESIGNLAGEIAHDFNNVLTAVTGFASILQIRMHDNDPLLKYVNEIAYAGKMGGVLTKKLLAFSRKQLLDMKPCNINDMLINLEGLLRRLIRADIELHFSLAEVPLVIEADWNQLEQIVINLVTNARDAMPEGGELTISTGPDTVDPLIAAQHGIGESGAGFAAIRITDNGLGMNEATRRRIFEPFFTTKEMGKGTGLGLSVVYGIIRQHRGIIRVKSEPGNGTEFALYFPLIKGNADGKVTEDIKSKRVEEFGCGGGSETILVASDQKCLRMMKKEILESQGYNVITAEDGEVAVKKFKEQPEKISLVIFDIFMQKKGGLKACAEIAGISPGTKALLVSGYGDEEVRQGAPAEQLPVLMKPFSSAELLKRVRELLDGTD